MTINKTKLLFIATLFFLALPLMFVNGIAQASVYNDDGAIHNATTGLYEVPSDASTCVGADASDPVDSPARTIDLSTIPTGQKCSTIQPAWVSADFTDQTTCEANGYQWAGKCTGYTSGHPHTEADCIAAGGVWTTPGPCVNFYTENPAYATQRNNHECLYCHNGSHATQRANYLKGGHKNMSRMADGGNWAGSIENGSSIYSGYLWNNPGTSANGTSYNATLADGTTPVFWIYDGWIGTAPRAATPGTAYACGRCHTTGWTADSSMQTTKEPYASFGANIFTDVNLSAADDSGTVQPYSSWDHFGILCSRCHNAVDGGHANSGPAADNMEFNGDAASAASQNAKCYNCHRQVDSNNLPLDAATRNVGTELYGTSSHGGPVGIKSHANGFLNSPHARFSGTYGQIGDDTKYDSHFTSYYGGCAACHNVHDSVTDTNPDGQPWNSECGVSCHSQSPSDPYGKPLTKIKHPNGPGTPLYGVTADDAVEACKVCHMPGEIHLFRISTDPSYVTFPAANQNAATVPDASNNNYPSAYVDLDMACGQCHGGSAGATATKNGAPYMSKDSLAVYAANMHNGVSTAPVANPSIGCGTNGVQIGAGGFATITPDVTSGSSSGETVVVAWGDGVVGRMANGSGSQFTHTYATTNPLTSNGDGTFNVTVTAIAPDGGMASAVCTATMPAGSTGFSGTVVRASDSTGIGGAFVYLQRKDGNGNVLNTYVVGTDATGAYSFNKIGLGTYDSIWVTKTGYTFDCSLATPCDPSLVTTITATNK
jgi:hypothetical protein